ncbi:hypothetical protein FE257_002108 [Aspergillus nanangensis]|uniref:Uncharacterized protein n=1 Tax=Aspergillus nanangensis TaxID=2582783 RepID=A0AAD4GWY9_ASPNN|nr:hypothetical protein FE257_002108 [Aspergillus nanangensis]
MTDKPENPSTSQDEEKGASGAASPLPSLPLSPASSASPASPESPSPRENWSFPKLIALITSILILLLFGNYARKTHQHATHPKLGHNCTLPTRRYDIYTGYASCTPSSGGTWISPLGPLELQHLSINRFSSTERSQNREGENHFCQQLRQFGGSWYGPGALNQLWTGDTCNELSALVPEVAFRREVGFPADGGVWVLTESKRGFPEGMAMVRNALTMEERCSALETLGAVWCESVQQCPALWDLGREPHRLVPRGFRKGISAMWSW